MAQDRVIAVGLLTQRDLDVLGQGFTRLYPIERDDQFAELIRRLDRVSTEAPAPDRRPATSVRL